MESELEKIPQDTSTGQQEEGREGYNAGGSYSRTYGTGGARTQRPRIHTQRAYSSDRRSSGGEDDGAFRPEGFGANLQGGGTSQQRQYRPRYNNYNNESGGYQQRNYNNNNNRGGYQQRQEGSYRPRYNNAPEGEGATNNVPTTNLAGRWLSPTPRRRLPTQPRGWLSATLQLSTTPRRRLSSTL